MLSWIRSMFGGEEVTEPPEDLSKLLKQAKRDKRALRDLLKRADKASKSFLSLAEPLETVQATVDLVSGRVAELQGRVESVEAAGSAVEVVERRSRELEASQRERSSSLEETARDIEDLQTKVLELRAIMDDARAANDEMSGLTGPNGAVARLLKGVDQLNADFERMKARGASLESQAEELGKSQGRLTGSFKQAFFGADRLEDRVRGLDDQVSSLKGDVQSMAVAKQEIEDLAGPEGALAKIRKEVERAREQSLDYGENVARIREDQAELRNSHESVAARHEELRSRMDALGESTAKAVADIAKAERTMQDLEKADELSVRTERQLKALKALADHMNQKIASLERHREAIDRTEAQARALTDLHWELESKLKEARTQVKEVQKVDASIDNLRTVGAKVVERSDELRKGHAAIHKENKLVQATMRGLQEQMRHSTKQFELEQSSLEAISQRIIALRAGLTEFENRFRALDGTSKVVTEVGRKVDDVSARASTISAELGRLSEQAELVEGMREGMTQALATTSEVAGSLKRVEARRSEIQEAVDDLARLRASREEVANTLERLRATRAELERLQTAQSETGAWLATTHESMTDLQRNVAQLDDIAANVDHMRQNADHVLASATDLEARKESFEELEARMSELRQVGSQMDERTSNLLSTLADADHRLTAMARRADEADEVRIVIEGVSAEVQQAERRMEELGGGVESVAERQGSLTMLSQRVDRLMADIEQGRQALTQAAEHFDRVAELRKEAAGAVQTLEDQIRSASENLRNAEEQSAKVGARAERLEARAGSLRFAEKRITQFEEKLARLDKVEQELDRSIETLVARQESLDQIRDDVQALFATSESTLEDVRAISAARDEVQGASEMLDIVRAKADTMEKALGNIDDRQRQIEKAEEGLSHADALLMEIRVGLESLVSQKAVVDHVIATSGKLTFEAKEAEGLIQALREERELTQGVHDAVKKLRETDTDIRAI